MYYPTVERARVSLIKEYKGSRFEAEDSLPRDQAGEDVQVQILSRRQLVSACSAVPVGYPRVGR